VNLECSETLLEHVHETSLKFMRYSSKTSRHDLILDS